MKRLGKYYDDAKTKGKTEALDKLGHVWRRLGF